MRQALLLLVAIAALAALAVYLVRQRSPAPSAVQPVATPEAAPAPVEAPVADPETSARTPAVVQSARTRASEESNPTPIRRGAPAAVVGVVVEFAGTRAPVRNALASLTYQLKDKPPHTQRMQALKNGRFQLPVPVGAQLLALDVCGLALMLEGPRVNSNAGSRFRPLRAQLDSTLESGGAELRFEVEPALDLKGVVLDSESRLPVEGANLELSMPVGRPMRVLTEADGRFQLADPGPGRPIRVRREGYLDTEVLMQPGDFTAPDPGLVVLLERGLRVSGSVFDEHGAPVSSAELQLYLRGVESSGRAIYSVDWRQASTDARGNFSFENLPRCAKATIREAIPDKRAVPKRTRVDRDLGKLTSDVEGLFLLCRDMAPVELRVVRRDGTPVPPPLYYCASEEPGLSDELLGLELKSRKYKVVALRVAVRLVVFTREREDDPDHLLIGRSTVYLDQHRDPAPVVRIVVDEPLDITPPASAASEVVMHNNGVLATLDLRLVDWAGKPLPAGTRMDLELGGKGFSQLAPADSTLRLRCRPSPDGYPARLDIGGQKSRFLVDVPMPGYSRAEQRVWIAP